LSSIFFGQCVVASAIDDLQLPLDKREVLPTVILACLLSWQVFQMRFKRLVAEALGDLRLICGGDNRAQRIR